ncbi:carbon-nitrogen hydrolase family protein, partial [Escherichia coli]|nr:carbon-nitrogen hydrolase family protein [Escherichia coli]
AANARAIVDGIARAATEGSAMLFTPEMSGLLDGNRERARRHVVAEAEDTVLAATREAAAKHGIWVHLGSLALRGEGDKFLNRGFVIDD